MPIKWIVFNGAPQSGKTSAANCMRDSLRSICVQRNLQKPIVVVDSLDAPLRHMVATAFGEKYNDMNRFDQRAELLGYSVTAWMEHMRAESEKHYGDDLFARLLVHRNLRNAYHPDYVIVDDGRAEQEGEAFTNPRIYCVRRSLHMPSPVPTWWKEAKGFIDNVKDHEHMYEQVRDLTKAIVIEDYGM